METDFFYSTVGVLLFGMGLFSVVFNKDIMRQILAVNVMGSGVFMILIANASVSFPIADPVPHAMVLTGVVVAVASTAMALSLMKAISHSIGDKG